MKNIFIFKILISLKSVILSIGSIIEFSKYLVYWSEIELHFLIRILSYISLRIVCNIFIILCNISRNIFFCIIFFFMIILFLIISLLFDKFINEIYHIRNVTQNVMETVIKIQITVNTQNCILNIVFIKFIKFKINL